MATLNTLNTLNTLTAINLSIDSIKNNKKDMKEFKIVAKVLHDNKIRLPQNHIFNISKNLDILNTFNIASSASDIQSIYDDVSYGTSCLSPDGCYRYKGRSVGQFYNSIDIELAIIQGARCLINPENKQFYKSYGENHYILESILYMLGYTYSPYWLNSKEIITETKVIRNKSYYFVMESNFEYTPVREYYSFAFNNPSILLKWEWDYKTCEYNRYAFFKDYNNNWTDEIKSIFSKNKHIRHDFIVDYSNKGEFLEVFDTQVYYPYSHLSIQMRCSRKVVETRVKKEIPEIEVIENIIPYIDGDFKAIIITIDKRVKKYPRYECIQLDVDYPIPKLRGKFISAQKNRAYKNKNKKKFNKLLID